MRSRRAGVTLEKILITHGHIDHCGQAGVLAKELGLPIEGPQEADRFWISRLDEDGRSYGIAGRSVRARPLAEGWRHGHGRRSRTRSDPLPRPHARPRGVLSTGPTKFAIVGDVLFRGSIGRTDFPMGNHQDLLDSITQKLWPLGDVTFIPGHGPVSTFGQERLDNPFVGDAAISGRLVPNDSWPRSAPRRPPGRAVVSIVIAMPILRASGAIAAVHPERVGDAAEHEDPRHHRPATGRPCRPISIARDQDQHERRVFDEVELRAHAPGQRSRCRRRRATILSACAAAPTRMPSQRLISAAAAAQAVSVIGKIIVQFSPSCVRSGHARPHRRLQRPRKSAIGRAFAADWARRRAVPHLCNAGPSPRAVHETVLRYLQEQVPQWLSLREKFRLTAGASAAATMR